MANRWPLDLTMIAGTMARLIGTVTVKVVPCPSTERTTMVPFRALIERRTTSIPTPRPDTSLTVAAVEKPGRKIISCASSGVIS